MKKKKTDGLMILVIVLAVLVLIVSMLLAVKRLILPAVSGRTRETVIRRELRLGKRYLSEMEYDKAVTAFTKAVELDENNTAAYTGLGDAYTGLGKWSSAVENYDRAVITVVGVLPQDGASEDEIRELTASAQSGEEPLQNSYGEEVFDGDYVIDVVVRRDDALESGLLALDSEGAEDGELIEWLENLGHVYYRPKDENLRERIGTDTVTEEASIAAYEDKIADLADEYGVLPMGEEELEVPIVTVGNSPYQDYSGDVFLKDTGLLAADIYDYDNDGASELLTIRRDPIREPSDVTGIYYEYSRVYAELYEKTADGFVLADSRQFSGVDSYGFFVSGNCLEFFRCTDSSGKTIFYVESYMTGQDHADDVSLLAFSCDGNGFTDEGGARLGYWFDEDSYGIYFEPDSQEAAMHMSESHDENSGWRIVERPLSFENNDNTRNAFEEGLGNLGLQLLHRRQSNGYVMTADQCYASADGKMTRLGRLCLTHLFEQGDYVSDYTLNYLLFMREREDCIGTLTSVLQAQQQEEDSQQQEEESPQEEPQQQEEEEAQQEEESQEEKQDLTMEGIGLSYGHYDGIKPQGDGAIPAELDLYEDGTFRMHCVFPLFSQNDPEGSDYEYTYTGTYTVDRIDADGNAVLAFKCDVTDFEMTWDGNNISHEDFFFYQ